LNRRDFIKGSLLFFGFSGCASLRNSTPSGSLSGGPDYQAGHLLKEKAKFPQPAETRRIRTAVLGSGVAGLSAAWQLNRSGWEGVELFELQDKPGGNSRYAEYAPSLAPWAAHYLPIPTKESHAVRELLKEMGLMSVGRRGQDRYDERHLCHPQQERLWYRGRWHNSLVPEAELSPVELSQWQDFKTEIEHWQSYLGSDGKKAFAIPAAASSTDPELMRLDQVSFAEYAVKRGWTSSFVHWLLEYATRDDYGGGLGQVSAWAGLHYFAARDGGGFRDTDAVFVWPEGNGRLVRYLRDSFPYPIHSEHLITKVKPGQTVQIDALEVSTKKMVRFEADNCLYCLPAFQRSYHLDNESKFTGHYAPWVTANLVLERSPSERSVFSEPAWDNVIHDSPSLGYVVATHQSKAMSNAGSNVWTWYRSFPNEDPSEVRKQLLESKWEWWKEQILQDLGTVHSNIEQVTTQIDVALFGHAMIAPTVGTIWGNELKRIRRPLENVWFAHADLSGISIFEEAQYRGVLAAQQLMESAKHPFKHLVS
jgi:putative NAD(P)-binding protein